MFYELNFPDSIAFNSVGSLIFDTNVIRSKNGVEQRNYNRDFPLVSYKISNKLKNRQEMEQILSLFRIVKGKLNGFRFRDWLDYKINNQIIGIGDGENTKFQIKKIYKIENDFVLRDIVKPVQNTVSVFLEQTNYTNLVQSIDYSNGLVTFIQPPSSGEIVTVNCEFDVPVRFKEDALNITIVGRDLFEINDLELVELLDA